MQETDDQEAVECPTIEVLPPEAPLPHDPAPLAVESQERFDYMIFFKDTFKEDLFRSKRIKEDLFDRHDKCMNKLDEVLSLPVNKDTAATVFNALKWTEEQNIQRLELPKIQLLYSKTERLAGNNGNQHQTEPVRISRDEMKDFVIEAAKAERAIDDYKHERAQLEVNDVAPPSKRLSAPRR